MYPFHRAAMTMHQFLHRTIEVCSLTVLETGPAIKMLPEQVPFASSEGQSVL